MLKRLSCSLFAWVLSGSLVTPVVAGDAPVSPYALIADAGSTGTRMYLFHVVDSSPSEAPTVDVTDLGKGPALSSFQDTPHEAGAAVAKQLLKAAELIPKSYHSAVPLSVLATAGMRLVAPVRANAIYAGLRASLLGGNFPFNANALQARTISGRDEGIYAMLAANFLSQRLHVSLQVKGDLIGVLDLGGSSTQIAVPPDAAAGANLAEKLGEGQGAYSKSFLSLGMERMRQKTYQGFTDAAAPYARERRTVANPCAFYGYSEEGEPWRGTGDSAECERAIKAILEAERTACAAQAAAEGAALDCLPGGPAPLPSGGSGEDVHKFLLISGYLYVTDFARWWLARPGSVPASSSSILDQASTFARPNVAELREAAQLLCAETWADVSAAALDPSSKHSFTGAHKVPHRCFEANYVVSLLSHAYGFDEGARLFRVVADVNGNEIEWTLGAFLHDRAIAAGERSEL